LALYVPSKFGLTSMFSDCRFKAGDANLNSSKE
jgi:hypothetical protein